VASQEEVASRGRRPAPRAWARCRARTRPKRSGSSLASYPICRIFRNCPTVAGANLTGRTAALLVDLAVEATASGWRFAERPGRDVRRARSYLARDLDALEETCAGLPGPGQDRCMRNNRDATLFSSPRPTPPRWERINLADEPAQQRPHDQGFAPRRVDMGGPPPKRMDRWIPRRTRNCARICPLWFRRALDQQVRINMRRGRSGERTTLPHTARVRSGGSGRQWPGRCSHHRQAYGLGGDFRPSHAAPSRRRASATSIDSITLGYGKAEG